MEKRSRAAFSPRKSTVCFSREGSSARGARAFSAAMGLSAAAQPHFQTRDAEQRAMVLGAEERLREYRRMLPGGDLAQKLDGRFWDAVVLTAANDRQAETYVAQLDALHKRGQLPGTRGMYLVIPDPPGPRVGSGGATLHVMLKLQAIAGTGWSEKRLFLLHAGGYSERSPAHGTLGKAFGQLPLDAANLGVPATILEAQLLSFQELPKKLPPGVFISSADIAVQFGKLPRLDFSTDEFKSCERGILALGHASSVEIGTGHGVFVCDREELNTFAKSSGGGDGNNGVVGKSTDDGTQQTNTKKPVSVLTARRCLQKPSKSLMRSSGAVLPSPRAMGHTGGSSDEWVLTDSAFHIGAGACQALTKVAAENPAVFSGVEICAYGDFMQPMGCDADSAYTGRTDQVASLNAHTEDKTKASKLREARILLSKVLRSRPLLALPLVPSRFVHVGTMPELLQHCVRDDDVLAAFPTTPSGIGLGTWDVEKMDPMTLRLPSVGADGVWGAGPGVGVGSCFLASRADRGARVGTGSLLVHCDLGRQTVVGEGCLLHDVDLPNGVRVPPGTFLHCVPLNAAAAAAAGVQVPSDLNAPNAATNKTDSSTLSSSSDLNGGAPCWTCIVLSVEDEVKKAGKSTLCGVNVEVAAARATGLDTATGDAVWSEGEAKTTTLARVFPVCATAGKATLAALHMLDAIRARKRFVSRQSSFEQKMGISISDAPGEAASTLSPGGGETLLRVSISEALRVLANHGSACGRREALRCAVVGHAVGALLTKDTPVEQWQQRAPPLRGLRVQDAQVAYKLAETCDPRASRVHSKCRTFLREKVRVGRVALALAKSKSDEVLAETTAKTCLRDAICVPFRERGGTLFGRQALLTNSKNNNQNKTNEKYSVQTEYPVRLNLAGGWTDTPPYALERHGAVLHVAILTEETTVATRNGDATAGGKTTGKLRRPIRATASLVPDARGVLKLVTEASSYGDKETAEQITTVTELRKHDNPHHHFALLRACAYLAIAPADEGKDKTTRDVSSNSNDLASLLETFLGIANCGVEIRTIVDLPRGSGLGTSSILALSVLHALHELGTRRKWVPADLDGNSRWAGRSAVGLVDGKTGSFVSNESLTENRLDITIPTSRDLFNSILAVEQMITTGGGWQDQVGGALEGMRLTRSTPGGGSGLRSLPTYETRNAIVPPAAAAFLSRHVVCVFTGTCRLAATVARSVVDAWQRRTPGVEKALRQCAALGVEMTDALDRLGALSSSDGHFAGAGSTEAQQALKDIGSALEKHKAIQEELWPSIASVTVKAMYACVEKVTLGSHICGAGNGGHVVCVLRPGVTREMIAAEVGKCVEAPEAKVVRVQMMLGGGGGAAAETAKDVTATIAADVNVTAEPMNAPEAPIAATNAPAVKKGGAGGRGRGGRGVEGCPGRGRKKRRTG